MKIEVMVTWLNDSNIVPTGGFPSESATYLMDIETLTWRQGPDYPYGADAMSYVQYKDSVLFVGGIFICLLIFPHSHGFII